MGLLGEQWERGEDKEWGKCNQRVLDMCMKKNLVAKCIVMYNNNKNTHNCDMRVIQERSWEDDA